MKTPFLALAALPALLLATDPPAPPSPSDYKDAKTEVPVTNDERDLAKTAEGELSALELETLAKLHHDNEMEIQMGKLAKKNGASKQVKAYGDVLVKDHTLADKQLKSFAKRKNVDLTMPAPKDQLEAAELQAAMDKMKMLEGMKGEEFDREFAKMMVEDHTKAVERVETTLSKTTNAKVQSLLNKVLPVLREHLKLAEKLNSQYQSA